MKINNIQFFTNSNDYFKSVDENSLVQSLNYFNAKVVDYPENNLPGSIYFRIFNYDNKSTIDDNNLFIAFPLNPLFYNKPVPNQIIKILNIQGNYYYFGTTQITDNENGDFIFDFSNDIEMGVENKPNTKTYKDLFSGNKTPNQSGVYDLKDFIKKDDKIIAIEEKPGDTIIKGLQNNNIVLSYDDNGEPITSILIKRDNSNYNQNSNGILIYGNLDIDKDFDYASDKKISIPKNESDGSVNIINLDKIRINSKNGSIVLSSKNKIVLTSNNDINIDNKTKVNINSPEIYLGEDADEPIVKGNQLKKLLEEILNEITNLTVLTPQGPSSKPVNIANFKLIKQKLKTILSTQNKTK